jgi:glycosyltransferase involved in cell wall biosynthesis
MIRPTLMDGVEPMPSSENPLVSVVLPTHNRDHIIEISVRSVLAQTYKNLEVIIIDDASTDRTQDIIRDINDKRLKYVQLRDNIGASAARNKGIDLASGEFIAFQDSDVIWLPTKIENQIRTYHDLERTYDNVQGCFCRLVKIKTGNLSSVIPTEKNLRNLRSDYHRLLLQHNIVDTPTLIVKRELLHSLGGFDTTLSTDEDWDLALRLTKKHRIAFTDEILVVSTTSSDGVNSNPRAANILKIISNNIESFKSGKSAYSLQLRTAAIDRLKNNHPTEAVALARKSLGIKLSIKALIIYFSPKFYSFLKGVKK